MNTQGIAIFWFRRDLRLEDNVGLFRALNSRYPVIPLFIFDEAILDSLPKNDARVGFIHESLSKINQKLQEIGSALLVKKGKTQTVWQQLIQEFDVKEVFFNKDYEPYAIKRDLAVSELLTSNAIESFSFRDQVVFEENEITKSDGLPYTVYTPYKNKWLEKYTENRPVPEYECDELLANFYQNSFAFPTLEQIGFNESTIKVQPYSLKHISHYQETRPPPIPIGSWPREHRPELADRCT